MLNLTEHNSQKIIDLAVIVVCYNSEKTIRRCLDSIANQSCIPAELIIIDGASSDNTLSIVSDFHALTTLVLSETDEGIYYAMNKGISLVTSNFFMFLNSDDYFKDSSSLKQYEIALNDPKVDLLFSNIRYVDDGKVTRVWDFHDAIGDTCVATRIPHPGAIVRKSVVQKVGYFNTDFKIAADFDYFLRILQQRITYKHINYYTVDMEVGGASDGNILSIIKQNIEILRSVKLNGYGLLHMVHFLFDRLRFKLSQKV